MDESLAEAALTALDDEAAEADSLGEVDLTAEEVEVLAELGSTAELWERFKRTEDASLHEQIVLRYLPFVESMAIRTSGHLPLSVDLNDLVQDGTLGLLDAIGSFDPSLGVKFETFAGRRIKGAILDGIRSMDWVARLDRARQSLFYAARERLFQEGGVEPSDEQIATALGVEGKVYEKFKAAVRYGVNHKSAEDVRHPSNRRDFDKEPTLDDLSPVERDKSEHVLVLREAIQELAKIATADARQLLELMLYEGLSLREAGEFVGITQSRGSQIISRMMHDFVDALHAADQLPPGNVLRCLREEYGEVRGLESNDARALPAVLLEALGGVNATAPIQFELTGGDEAFVDTTSAQQFEALVKEASRHEDRARPGAVPDDGGFTFFEAPEENS